MTPSKIMLTDDLSKIIKTCWADFQQLKGLKTTVRPSIPILWFGDLEEYRKSPVRILTVALNPSDKEFHTGEHRPYQVGLRFPAAAGLAGNDTLDASSVVEYYKAMNRYFEVNPYTKWFDNFEKPLNVLNATYYGKKTQFANRAVHIDIMTPIATNPTWGKLGQAQELYLKTLAYFEALMEEFDPQIFLISVGQEYIRQRLNVDLQEGKTYVVARRLENNRLMIAGRNARDPFRGPGMTDVYVRERMLEIKKSYKLCVGESGTVTLTKANESNGADDAPNKTEGGQNSGVKDERKVGEIARTDFRKTLESGRVPDEEIARLTDPDYSKRTFKLSTYPVLSRERQPAERFYAQPLEIKIRGRKETFYMCSQWNAPHKPYLEAWIERFKPSNGGK